MGLKDGETTNDLCAFLTTELNTEVGAMHRNAMPFILRSLEEIASQDDCASICSTKAVAGVSAWGILRIEACGGKKDGDV